MPARLPVLPLTHSTVCARAFSLYSKGIRSLYSPFHPGTHFPPDADLLPRAVAHSESLLFLKDAVCYISYFSCCYDKILNNDIGKKKGLLCFSVRVQSSVWGSHGPRSLHCIHSEKSERMGGAQRALPGTSAPPTQGCSSDLIQTLVEAHI